MVKHNWGFAWVIKYCALLAMGAILASVNVYAEETSAHGVAEAVKNELVAVIKNKDSLIEEGGAEKYFDAVQEVLEPVVDFKYIARGVMGEFAKQASPEQRNRFEGIFKRSLVSTYANGMSGYVDHEIVVVPPKGDVSNDRSVAVGLEVRGGDTINRLSFNMKKNRQEEWKLTNMVLNGVNFGVVLRAQFAQAMAKNSNNLDVVIDSWSA